MDFLGKPPQPDNAQESIKCIVCGRAIELDDILDDLVTCPVCGHENDILEDQIMYTSNEDY